MPAWVLVLTGDAVQAAEIEAGVRLAGFSPRRAPDWNRCQVLLRQGEAPAAAVIDLSRGEESRLQALSDLPPHTRRLVLTPDEPRDLASRATRAGAVAISPPHTGQRIAAALQAPG